MSLLLDEDYVILKESGLRYVEDEQNRFLVFPEYPVREGVYEAEGKPVDRVEVLVVIPDNYNMAGTDMLWVYPSIKRRDGGAMPNVHPYGKKDNRKYDGKEFCRWSRHYHGTAWKPKVDNVQKIMDRIEWALQNPGT